MKNITVIGAGGTGQCFAADMFLAGHNVTIFDNRQTRLDEISQAGGILLYGGGRTGKASPRVCSDIKEALQDAELIVICAVSTTHRELADLCAPYLKDGQTVFISAGSASSLIFDSAIKKARGNAEKHGVLLGELEGNLYPCRRTQPAQIFMSWPLAKRMVSAFPASNTSQLQKALEGVLDTSPASNIFETALNSPNVVIHLMGSMLNLGAIDHQKEEYRLYKSGLTPSVLTMLEAMDAEKQSVYTAWGWNARSPMPHMHRVACQDSYPELNGFRSLVGPLSAQHRYLSEDAESCICLMADLGRIAGVKTPLTESLLHLAGALHKKDYLSKGRTLSFLGLGNKTQKEIADIISGNAI